MQPAEVRDFLTSRRARITPEQAGLPAYGGNRRVAGLRREEVAMLAGVSVDYYTRLERGNLANASDSVLGGIARALQLDEAETLYLFNLSKAAQRARAIPRPSRSHQVRESLQHLLDAMGDVPAIAADGFFNTVGSNRMGRALYAPMFDEHEPNSARFIFLSPAAQEFFLDWNAVTEQIVGSMRTEVGRNPFDKRLSGLVGELSTRSDRFRQLWAAQGVRQHTTGVKLLHHPIVGELELTYESLVVTADSGLRINTYVAKPGSSSADGLKMLAAWAATHEVEAELANVPIASE